MEFAHRLTNQARKLRRRASADHCGRPHQPRGALSPRETSAGHEYGTRAVLVATGSRYRRLGVPGDRALVGAVVHCCAICDGPFYRDRTSWSLAAAIAVSGGSLPATVRPPRHHRGVPAGGQGQQAAAGAVADQRGMAVVTNHAIQAFRADAASCGVTCARSPPARSRPGIPTGSLSSPGSALTAISCRRDPA